MNTCRTLQKFQHLDSKQYILMRRVTHSRARLHTLFFIVSEYSSTLCFKILFRIIGIFSSVAFFTMKCDFNEIKVGIKVSEVVQDENTNLVHDIIIKKCSLAIFIATTSHTHPYYSKQFCSAEPRSGKSKQVRTFSKISWAGYAPMLLKIIVQIFWI